MYQEATMPIEDVIAKYESNEDESENCASSEENSNSKPKILKNPLVANLAGSSGSKGVSPFLRAKAPSIDKNGIKDESVAKEIDFNKDNTNSDITNGIDTSDKQLNSNESSTENINNDKSKIKVNGEHTVQNKTLNDNSISDNSLKGENADKTSDKTEEHVNSNDSKKDISSTESNGNLPAIPDNESKDISIEDQEQKVRALVWKLISAFVLT